MGEWNTMSRKKYSRVCRVYKRDLYTLVENNLCPKSSIIFGVFLQHTLDPNIWLLQGYRHLYTGTFVLSIYKIWCFNNNIRNIDINSFIPNREIAIGENSLYSENPWYKTYGKAIYNMYFHYINKS